MNVHTRRELVAGAAGAIEVAIDEPVGEPRGLAMIAHPHPLFGGTLDNKVAQTLARALLSLGYLAARPNFRGVGQSEGAHDEGRGETDDLLLVLDTLLPRVKQKQIVLAGFSFGGFVQTHVAARLAARGTPAERLILVAPAVTRNIAATVPPGTLVIHGEEDDTVPLAAVLDWARPQDLPIVLVPGTNHFFHRKLNIIKQIVLGPWPDQGALGASEPEPD